MRREKGRAGRGRGRALPFSRQVRRVRMGDGFREAAGHRREAVERSEEKTVTPESTLARQVRVPRYRSLRRLGMTIPNWGSEPIADNLAASDGRAWESCAKSGGNCEDTTRLAY